MPEAGRNHFFKIVAIILFAFSLAACMPAKEPRSYPPSASDDLIFWTTGNAMEGVWTTNDMDISYNCSRDGDVMEFRGTVTLAQRLMTGFDTLDHLSVSVQLVDADRNIIATRPLMTVAGRKWMTLKSLEFQSRMGGGLQTTAIRFIYRGRVTSGSPRTDDNTGMDFYRGS